LVLQGLSLYDLTHSSSLFWQAKKVETKTLDGTITRLNAEGEKVSVSSKCADLDREVCSIVFSYKTGTPILTIFT